MRNSPLLVAVLLGLTAGCSGGGSSSNSPPPPPPISISVTPGSASVAVNATQQFTANITGTANRGVTWSLSGAGCTGAECGTLSGTSTNPVTYTAPAGVPSQATIKVTASSQADPSKSAFGTVTVTTPPVVVGVAPNAATVVVGGTLEFTASVAGTANADVAWSLTGAECAGAACGTLSSETSNPVTYTAPATGPLTATLVATSQADSSKSAAATITVAVSNNFKLKGQYAFLFTGFDTDGPVGAAGTFIADGDGQLTDGVEDITRSSGVSKHVAFTGAYSVGSDLRGSFTLTSAMGTSTYRFALQVGGDAQFIEFDMTGTHGTGILKKQNPAAFSTGALTGDLALSLSGSFLGGSRIGMVGRFSADGAGNVVNGVCDVSLPGMSYSKQPLSGAYAVETNGRGTALLQALVPSTSGVFNFSFYVVSSGEMLFLSTDNVTTLAPLLSGIVLQQSGAPFTPASLRGASIFRLAELDSSTGGSNTALGQMIADGGGNLAGVLDQNAGNVVLAAAPFAGTYDLSPEGRGTLRFTVGATSRSHAIYMIRENKAFILGTSAPGADVALGLLEPQSAGPFDDSSLAGAYALGTLDAVSPNVPDFAGMVAADGSGSLSGTGDETTPAGLSPDQALAATYRVGTNGRGRMVVGLPSGSLTNLVFWIVSPSKTLLISADASRNHNAVLVLEK